MGQISKRSAGASGRRAKSGAHWKAALEVKIEKLAELERKAFGPRHGKINFYRYLKAVYSAWDWTSSKTARRVARRVAKLYKVGTNRSPIRLVIDVTSTQNRQVKSRWVRALEYAMAKGIAGHRLIRFLKENGGVLGCARKMAKRARKETLAAGGALMR